MGKSKKSNDLKNSKNVSNTTISQINKTVSLITITQLKRFECLKILFEIICNQTYKNIIEWILVEGSKSKEDADSNEQNIMEFINSKQSELSFQIIYIKREFDKDYKLGELEILVIKNAKVI